jgi:hypothetical protein
MATADVEVSLSADARTDEESDLLVDELAELRRALGELPGVDRVSYQADTSDPQRQGAELLHLALELIPSAVETLLVLIESWRDRRRKKKKKEEAAVGEAPAAAALAMTINLTIKTAAGEVILHVDGSEEQALPTAKAIIDQLTAGGESRAVAAGAG